MQLRDGPADIPRVIGIGRYAGNTNATCMQVNEKQHVIRNRPSHSPHCFREEVGCPDGFGMSLDEVVPTSLPAFWTRVEAVFLEDATDRSMGNTDSQLLEFTDDTIVAPGGGFGHLDNELGDCSRVRGRSRLRAITWKHLFDRAACSRLVGDVLRRRTRNGKRRDGFGVGVGLLRGECGI